VAATWSADRSDRQPLRGAYVGPADPDGLRAFERFLGGARFDLAEDFASADDWNGIEMAGGFPAAAWQGSGYRTAYGIPLLPTTLDGAALTAQDNGAALARGAAGEFDRHFHRLGESLVERGQPRAVLRLGWEFNSDFFAWSVGVAEPGHDVARKSRDFAALWRRAALALDSVRGGAFVLDWNPLLQDARSPAPDPALAWPGDDVVDLVGLDVYDTVPSDRTEWDAERRWSYLLDGVVDEGGDEGYALRWHARFAEEHGKRLSFPEWGLVASVADGGGGDAPVFVERFADWVSGHSVAYQVYFERETSSVDSCLSCAGRFPEALAAYRSRFG
jgi:hypothetical protein